MRRRVRALLSRAALAAEGRDMRHCVGGCGLDDRTRDGRVIVLAIDARGQRATVTLALDGRVTVEQNKGPGNRTPIGPLAERTLRAFLYRVEAILPARGAREAAESDGCRGC